MKLAVVKRLCQVVEGEISFFLILELGEAAVKLMDLVLFKTEFTADVFKFLIFKFIMEV